MQRQDLSDGSWLAAFIEAETRHIDLVASWETLVSMYEQLRFLDELTDRDRMEEFKWIVKEMNKFLTRARNSLGSCVKRRDSDGAMSWLIDQYSTKDATNVTDRKSLVYAKLKQQWLHTTSNSLARITEDQTETEKETDYVDEW